MMHSDREQWDDTAWEGITNNLTLILWITEQIATQTWNSICELKLILTNMPSARCPRFYCPADTQLSESPAEPCWGDRGEDNTVYHLASTQKSDVNTVLQKLLWASFQLNWYFFI